MRTCVGWPDRSVRSLRYHGTVLYLADSAPNFSEPLLSRFAVRAGFVTLRQIFVHRCHGDDCPGRGSRMRVSLLSPLDLREIRLSVHKAGLIMLGKLSIIGVVAVIPMNPTALSAQMGAAVNPGVNMGGAVNAGAAVRGAVVRGIPGPDLGTWRSPSREIHRSRKHSMAATRQR